MKPQRIQLKRVKGFNLNRASRALNGLPAISVARPSRFGNPYRVLVLGEQKAVENFEHQLRTTGIGKITCEVVRRELSGMNLACYCHPTAFCHADILLRIANEEEQ